MDLLVLVKLSLPVLSPIIQTAALSECQVVSSFRNISERVREWSVSFSLWLDSMLPQLSLWMRSIPSVVRELKGQEVIQRCSVPCLSF